MMTEADELVGLAGVERGFRSPGGDAQKVLKGINLSVRRGVVVAVSGPSGTGKTTLLGVAGLLWRPDAGKVRFLGRDATSDSRAKRNRLRREHVGFVFQQFALFERLPAWESVALPLLARGWPLRQRRSRSLALLEELGLADKALNRTEELSGGEKQRVSICRALATDPDLIVADEPVSNMDPKTASRVLALLSDARDRGAAVLISGHDPGCAAMADENFLLQDGRLSPLPISEPST